MRRSARPYLVNPKFTQLPFTYTLHSFFFNAAVGVLEFPVFIYIAAIQYEVAQVLYNSYNLVTQREIEQPSEAVPLNDIRLLSCPWNYKLSFCIQF
jgi:hypothetical protein